MRPPLEGPQPRPSSSLNTLVIVLWTAGILAAFFFYFPLPVRREVLGTLAVDLMVAASMAATAVLAGLSLLSLLRLRCLARTPAAELLYAAALGYGSLGLAGLLLARLQWLRPLPLVLLWALVLLWSFRRIPRLVEGLRHSAAVLRQGVGNRGLLFQLLGVLLTITMAMMLLEALAPPTSYDALRYHLRLPQLYADAGGWVPVSHDFNTAFPGNVNMLYAVALSLGAPGAAKLTHLMLGWLAVAAVALLASRSGGKEAGLPAAAIFYTMPVVALNSAWAYVDMGLALHTFLAIAAVLAWWRQRESSPQWLLLAGLLLGLGLGTKYTGAVALVVLPVGILLRPLARPLQAGGRRWGPALLGAVLVVGTALAVASPWWGTNWVVRGNPVYPFASGIFEPDEADSYREERHRFVLGRPEVPTESITDVAALPWRFSMTPWVRDEMIGPALLVAVPVVLLARGGGAGILLLLAGVFAAFWGVLSPQVRLYLHGLGLLSATAGASLVALRSQQKILGRVAGAGLLCAMLLSVGNLGIMQKGLSDPFGVVTGMESREHYLARMVDGHAAIQFANRELPRDAKILFVGEIYGFYCRRAYQLGSKFDRAPIVTLISESADFAGFLERLKAEGYTHLLYSMHQLKRFADLPGETLDWPDERSRRIYRRFMVERLETLFESPEAIVARISVAEAEPGPATGETPRQP